MSNSEVHRESLQIGKSSVYLRRDLQVTTIRRGLDVKHVVKDPVNLKYYEFDEHEMHLIQQLDGTKTWDEICRWYNLRFPPLRLSHRALQSMLWRLYKQGLLLTVGPGHGRKVAERALQLSRQKWVRGLTNPWAIKLPGIDPGPWLGKLSFLVGWIFSPLFIGFALLSLLVLLSFIFTRIHAVVSSGLETILVFSNEDILFLGLSIITTKMLHELGHAVAASRNGCECHEMGVLLLVGLPTLYCDVSDAWMLPGRRQRICISLAGIWIELLIAGTAFVVWMNSVPGIVHVISFNVMAVCSIGTLVFNANPLVRYDGYYVLMDLTGTTNLGQRSQEAVSRFAARCLWGTPDLRPFDAPEIPSWCLFYGIAAGIYRVILTFAILWGLHVFLKPYSLSVLVWIVATFGFAAWMFKMTNTLKTTIQTTLLAGTPVWRVAMGMIFLGLGSYLALSTPFSWYIFGDAVLEPSNQQTIVSSVSGRLVTRKDSGISVGSGDSIVKLENHEFASEVNRMQSELTFQAQHLESLLSRRHSDPQAAEQIPHTRSSIEDLKRRLNHLIEEEQRLEIRSREATMIYAAPNRLETFEEDELIEWRGSLLDYINRDAWVAVGDAVCQIGTPDRMEAVAVLAQDDLEAVRVGQNVDILLKCTGTIMRGEIEKISFLYVDSKSETSSAADLRRIPQSNGRSRIRGNWYQVRIRCNSPVPEGARIRSRGRARIHVGTRTIGGWIAAQFFKTFRWHA